METIIYRCPVCGNIMVKVMGSEQTPQCCGKPMEKLEPNTIDGKQEYHVPTVHCCKEGSVTINVGKMLHPMTDQHSIQFVILQSENGAEIRYLKPTDPPTVTFHTTEKPIAVYAYCNQHGLWVDKCER